MPSAAAGRGELVTRADRRGRQPAGVTSRWKIEEVVIDTVEIVD
jgi:hypothetical protein